MCAAENPDSHMCITGRHRYQNVVEAGASGCCKPFRVEDRALLAEEGPYKSLLPALSQSIDELTSKIQGYRDLKQSLGDKVVKNRAARSDALSRGELLPVDAAMVCAPEDIRALDAHIARESETLRGLTNRRHEANSRLIWIKGQLALAEKLKLRDAIYGKMAEVITVWNGLVREIVQLRQEANLGVAPDDLNRGWFPLFPSGIVETVPGALAPIFCLRPERNITQKEILAWKAPDTD
jgi:hypothetical protein